ncbi:hypothetical protein F5X68DRAFT_230258 [Plectosphaerella plurivora]|uniref:Uncharacterized protein n=1 Tax=Plectosphaerella plurivora TaxID=936078 RepID=A0A9P8VDR1_9PEZI|nr:hypothetical protein F5X68DRAFT_230258 [Plectosphaerella plurivora]
MDISGGIKVAAHDGLMKRQLLGNLLGRPKSLLDNLLNRQRTTTEEAAPAPTTSQAPPPPPPPTTTSPEPQQQPTTPPAPPPPPPSPSPTPVSTPTPAPPPPPPPPVQSSQPAPSPSPPPLPTTTSQLPKPAPSPIPRFSNILPAQPSAIVSKPTPEEAHQSLPASLPAPIIPLPTQDAEVLPGVTSIGPSSSTRLSILPTSGPGEPQEKGTVGKEPDSGMAFTQRLGLGIGLALFMVILVVAAVFICRWRRKICKKRKQDAMIASTTYPPDLKTTITPPQPILDPEIGIRQMQEQHDFRGTFEQPTLPYMTERDSSHYERQASTAAWAQKLQVPPSPVESEKEAETGIIRIFRWPTIASRSEITAMTKRGWAARSSARSSTRSSAHQSKDVSTSSWTSRASRSTLSTMLWRSRRSIARRHGEDGDDATAAEEETGILRDAQPAPLVPAPLKIDRKPIPPREPTQQLLTPQREKSRRKRRESALTVSSAGGGSIASSGVLSPTLLAFPVPPKGTSSLSLSMVFTGHDTDEPLPPLPATVYNPYRL